MRPRAPDRGFTIIEMMISLAFLSVVSLFIYKLGAPIVAYFRQSQNRQRANMEARSCLNTIGVALRAGLANSTRISNAAGVTAPSSRIDFVMPTPTPLASGTTAYMIYLAPDRTVRLAEYRNGLAAASTKVLANDASALMFTEDSRDPLTIYASLRIDAPLDASGIKTRVTTIELLNQEFHMVGTH